MSNLENDYYIMKSLVLKSTLLYLIWQSDLVVTIKQEYNSKFIFASMTKIWVLFFFFKKKTNLKTVFSLICAFVFFSKLINSEFKKKKNLTI